MLRLSAKQLLLFPLRSILVILLIPLFLVFITVCQKRERVVSLLKRNTIAYSIYSNIMLAHISFATGYLKGEYPETKPQFHAFLKLARNAIIEENADLAILAYTTIASAITNGKKIMLHAVIEPSNRKKAIAARVLAWHCPLTFQLKMHLTTKKNKAIIMTNTI
jgi:hypothetical protein